MAFKAFKVLADPTDEPASRESSDQRDLRAPRVCKVQLAREVLKAPKEILDCLVRRDRLVCKESPEMPVRPDLRARLWMERIPYCPLVGMSTWMDFPVLWVRSGQMGLWGI